MDSFEKLGETFNIDNDGVEDLYKDDKPIEEKDEIEKKTYDFKGQKYSLEDLEYMKAELQTNIENRRMVIDELKNCCKQGAAPRMFEVFAKMSDSLSDDIMKLAELSKITTDYQVTESKEDLAKKQLELRQQNALAKIEKHAVNGQTLIQNNVTNTYNMSSKDLLDRTLDEMKEKTEVITSEDDLPTFDLS